MLHRVDTPEDNGIWFNQHLKISPETIETMVAYARKKKCSFVSLDEMAEVLESKKKRRRIISITLMVTLYLQNWTCLLPFMFVQKW